ncbi:MAG: hypothetical protein JWN44_4714 [Myxococcales bacterium]|nr:hypothetical protein [Myxococcales bacterium]
MATTHTAVWIDHHEAHVFQVDPSSFSVSTVLAPIHVLRHSKRERAERNHPDDAPRFFRDVVSALAPASQVLVVGPSTAKVNFVDFMHDHAKGVEVVGVETVDHPTDKQVAAFVRQYFGPTGGDHGRS